MRGTLFCVIIVPYCAGIIPAYAGNTRAILRLAFKRGDHPRVCGEHFDHKGETLPAQGSSPRMRGTPVRCPNPIRRPRDHPRVCGEHMPQMPCVTHGAGSSPRMRGTPDRHQARTVSARIIPAYAGNTRARHPPQPKPWDHPRVCGEHFTVAGRVVSARGSSPRMRGTRVGAEP